MPQSCQFTFIMTNESIYDFFFNEAFLKNNRNWEGKFSSTPKMPWMKNVVERNIFHVKLESKWWICRFRDLFFKTFLLF